MLNVNIAEILFKSRPPRDASDYDRDSRGQYNDYVRDDRYVYTFYSVSVCMYF